MKVINTISASMMLVLILITANQKLSYAEEKTTTISTVEASAILQELKHIRSVLERIEKNSLNKVEAVKEPAPVITQISSINRPSLGDSDAPVTIVQISDYQCTYCKRFAVSTLNELKKKYIDTGKVRMVFKDLPMPFHENAKTAAQAAHCAGDQGKYWQMHDKLFGNIKQQDVKAVNNYARQLTLDAQSFEQCLSSKKHIVAIEKDMADANRAGLTGTPSFVIGKTTKDIIKGSVVKGAHPISSLEQYINKYM